jgi:hypothetical protein
MKKLSGLTRETMACKHGVPAPMECMWVGKPPVCAQCIIEDKDKEIAHLKEDRQWWIDECEQKQKYIHTIQERHADDM